jgi:hypothetical protein
MKKFLPAAMVLAFFFSSFQAQSQISAGPGIVYGTDINNLGFSINGSYDFSGKWSAAPSFTYFLKKNYVNWSSLDLDANYLFSEIENLGGFYAIGGLNITFWKIKYDVGEFGGFSGLVDANGSDAGVNLGIGLKFPAGEKFNVSPELKYTLGSASYLRFGVKIMFGL